MGSIRNTLRRLRHFVRPYPQPVLFYDMGGMDISGLVAHLSSIDGLQVGRAHYLKNGVTDPEQSLDDYLSEAVYITYRPKIITMVREPIARNVAAFKANRSAFLEADQAHLDFPEAAQAFIERYPYQVPEKWFTEEFTPGLGIDPYARPFPHEQGWQRIQTEQADVLLLKFELEPEAMREALAAFLELPDLTLPADAVRSIGRVARLPGEYLDRVYALPYARHFYSDKERFRLRDYWYPPVLIYQMGKVGSSSVYESLRRLQIEPLYHVHRLSPAHIEFARRRRRARGKPEYGKLEIEGLDLYEQLIRPGHALQVISTVREPISRNISAFFNNLPNHIGSWDRLEEYTAEQLIQIYLEEYAMDKLVNEVPLTWFDVEFKDTLGIDIYTYPFPKERGWLRFQHDRYDVLVFKIDVDDGLIASLVSEMLAISPLMLEKANVGSSKAYQALYRTFKQKIRLPREYVDWMCEARYTRHFFTDAEIAAIRDRWLGTEQPQHASSKEHTP